MNVTPQTLVKGKQYNWKHDAGNILIYRGYIYRGYSRSGNCYWHQFEQAGKPGVIWCEIRSRDLSMIEESA